MPHINLLPWRETLRKEREIRLMIITGMSLALAGVVVLFVHLYMSNELNYQQGRNNYLKAEIKKADAKIKEIHQLKDEKRRLVERMNVIQELEESRPNVVHLLDELVKQVPSGVYFTNMVQKDNKITLEGIAQSDARVSSLMANIEVSQWLTNPRIYSIVSQMDRSYNDKKRSVSKFKLEITQTTPEKPENSK